MAAGAAAVAATIANAIKASGAIVKVRREDFEAILRRVEKPLLVQASGGLFSTKYQYLVSYKGFVFFTKTPVPLQLPFGTELILADKIWLPS